MLNDVHTDGSSAGLLGGARRSTTAAREATMSTENGQTLGMQLKPGSANGRGLSVHAVTAGSQADATGSVYAGDVVTHVNGIDVVAMPIGEITALLKSSPTCTLRLVTPDELKARVPPSSGPPPPAVPPRRGRRSSSAKTSGGGAGAGAEPEYIARATMDAASAQTTYEMLEPHDASAASGIAAPVMQQQAGASENVVVVKHAADHVDTGADETYTNVTA